ncbi:CAZyme family GH16 [Penicillium canariense]|uniref:endo-1,3(4)-beta-glucanase n=1 Tax=Penicillium canariense TaxID=189055 RepID=A0A9W9IKB3_9EURO|nr:CAZyme family GH16 [Penicillium canariense]KAJ5177256.1 CAZyme family GH16 [Penicillium canariense]
MQRSQPRGYSLHQRPTASPTLLTAIVLATIISKFAQVVKANPNYSPLGYQLLDTYEGTSIFDQFYYFSDEDPTKGFVRYATKETAQDLNLTSTTDTTAILRVDSSTPATAGGRHSVRIESKNRYDSGLFIFDIIHTPVGCGTWPALWLTDGPKWPSNGEIDILESHNHGSHGNEMSLHTTAGCSMDVARMHSGTTLSDTCDISSTANAGCTVVGGPATYGEAFNSNGGGIYTLELRDAGIRIWFFPRSLAPSDLNNASPDPSTWGTPLADFPSTNCDIASHFRNLSIIANIDLCGELGALPRHYTEMYNCPGSCPDFVANNPSSFEEAYWEFGSIKVYKAL